MNGTTVPIQPKRRRWRVPRPGPRFLIGLASLVGVLALWQVLAEAGALTPLFFSSPAAVAREAADQLGGGEFWDLAGRSALEFAIGFGLAAVVGVTLGVCAGWFRGFGYFVEPWLNFFYALPRIALTPLLLIAFGIGQTAIIAVIFLGAVFEITLNTSNGARVVDRRLLDVAQNFGAGRRRVFTGIVLPSGVPFMIVGLRLGVARALIGVVIGELFAGGEGLGQEISLASNALQTPEVLFITVFFLLIAIVMTEGLRRVERMLGSWRNDMGGVR
ncbi:ABC transporter permease [Streptomyces sp. NPDC050560]|uniref:ABC transporter permease n=1 Tax=Streptomyces sp. NPDC050560 TaxID=3365630 RepID=UPI0037B7EAC7